MRLVFEKNYVKRKRVSTHRVARPQHPPQDPPLCWVRVTGLAAIASLFVLEISDISGRSRGATPSTRPPRVPILLFPQKNFMKHRCVGSWYPLTRLAPPCGKSWISHWIFCIWNIGFYLFLGLWVLLYFYCSFSEYRRFWFRSGCWGSDFQCGRFLKILCENRFRCHIIASTIYPCWQGENVISDPIKVSSCSF